MKKYIYFLLPVLFVYSEVYALPRFALKRGEGNCIGCHVNPTGGQLRGPGGVSYAINSLPMWKRGDSIKYSGQISDAIRLGGDFRSQVLYFSQSTPTYSTDSNSQTTKIGDQKSHVASFHAMSLAFELDVKATNTLHGFFRYDPLGITPSEGWTMLEFVHPSGEIFESSDAVTNAWVKVGAFMPAFGIRFDDHTAYVKGGNASISAFSRAGFFWSPGYRDVGGEIGALFFDHLGIVAGMFNGSEAVPSSPFNYDPKSTFAFCARVNLSGEIIENVLAAEVGFSHYLHPHDEGDLSLSAGHLSLRAGPVSILNEIDFGKNVVISGGSTMPKAMAFCSEAAINLTKGFDLILRYETFKDEKPTDTVFTEVKNRIMIGAQWFPLRFLEIRPEFRIANVSYPNSDLNVRDDVTENTFLIQTHVFF
jgi:hypothetical protein